MQVKFLFNISVLSVHVLILCSNKTLPTRPPPQGVETCYELRWNLNLSYASYVESPYRLVTISNIRTLLQLLTFCASSCFSKLTKPNPFDLPLSSVITFTLRNAPKKKMNKIQEL